MVFICTMFNHRDVSTLLDIVFALIDILLTASLAVFVVYRKSGNNNLLTFLCLQ